MQNTKSEPGCPTSIWWPPGLPHPCRPQISRLGSMQNNPTKTTRIPDISPSGITVLFATNTSAKLLLAKIQKFQKWIQRSGIHLTYGPDPSSNSKLPNHTYSDIDFSTRCLWLVLLNRLVQLLLKQFAGPNKQLQNFGMRIPPKLQIKSSEASSRQDCPGVSAPGHQGPTGDRAANIYI